MTFPRYALLLALALPAAAQTPTFLAADVHPAPHRSYPFFYAVVLHQNRYIIRDASLADLIFTAYDLNKEDVQGGPAWLDYDTFDIIAATPPNPTKGAQRLMLQQLLTDRFHLTLHKGEKSMPAYVLTAPDGKSKMKPSEGSDAEPTCTDIDAPGDDETVDRVSCKNMPMDLFIHQIHDMAGGYLNQPVVNATHLDGSYDFELHWTSRGSLAKAGADGISIFAAVEKQLGLKLELQTAPRPVILVDTADHTPTPNGPEVAKLLPPAPPPLFEVATIKPSKPDAKPNGNIGNGQVNFTHITMKDMVDLAWDLNEQDKEVIVNAPKWLDENHYDILAKVSPESSGKSAGGQGGGIPMDVYEVQLMLQALLIERFNIKAHMEDRPISSWTLVASNPKLKPADPAAHTNCKEGPGADGKDPRIANPQFNRLLTCTNLSMPQLADMLQRVAGGYIFNPILDSTGLKGNYDFTLSFSSADLVTPGNGSQNSNEPDGALSVFDALNHQLGLKLEKSKRSLPVLVIEHMDEKPAEN